MFFGEGGGVGEYRAWKSQYSRLYLGFTKLVNNLSQEQAQVLRGMREGELLIESDAPYFPLLMEIMVRLPGRPQGCRGGP